MDKSSIVLDIKQTNATTKQSPSCRLKVNCEISSSLTSVLIVLNDRNSLWRRIIRYVFIASLESARTWQQCDTFIRKPVVEVEIRDGGGLGPSSLHLRHSCHSLWRIITFIYTAKKEKSYLISIDAAKFRYNIALISSSVSLWPQNFWEYGFKNWSRWQLRKNLIESTAAFFLKTAWPSLGLDDY